MKVKILYDTDEYNSGVIIFSDKPRYGLKYNYETDIKELLMGLLNELNIDYSEKAMNEYHEEQED